jgi:hypothetical protein
MKKTRKHNLSVLLASLAALLVATLSISAILHAGESPTITITNESSETVVAKLRGPSSGSLSISAAGSRTINVRGGNYLALFRYGSGGRYSYTKVGPFQVVETDSEVSEVTIVLHAVAGNAQEHPSNEREFDSQ